MKSAGEIFAGGQIDSGLSSDRGIDGRKKGRRYLDAAHSSQIYGGGESGEISGDSAAEGDDHVRAGQLFRRSGVEDLAPVLILLVLTLLAGGLLLLLFGIRKLTNVKRYNASLGNPQ